MFRLDERPQKRYDRDVSGISEYGSRKRALFISKVKGQKSKSVNSRNTQGMLVH